MHCGSLRFVKNDAASRPTSAQCAFPPQPIGRGWRFEWNRRPPLLAICASAVLRTAGRCQRPLAICDMRRESTGERGLMSLKAWQGVLFLWFLIATRCSIRRGTREPFLNSTDGGRMSVNGMVQASARSRYKGEILPGEQPPPQARASIGMKTWRSRCRSIRSTSPTTTCAAPIR